MRPSTISGLLVPVVWVLGDGFFLLSDQPEVGAGALLFGLGVVSRPPRREPAHRGDPGAVPGPGARATRNAARTGTEKP
jgi:hypothetical protein